jgi:hypothetical protein
MERDESTSTIGELLGELTGELQALLRAEVELAKIETREELHRATDVGKKIGVAAGAAILAVLLVSFAAAWGLAEVMPAGLAFLIIGVVYAVVAAVFGMQARERLEGVNPMPEQTIETVKEDVQWARTRAR